MSPVVFLSHASADVDLVSEFDDTILRNGYGLDADDIVYSSGDDTAIPDGDDLFHFIRTAVGDASVVIAILTPTFQTRPVCVAELGAAWARAGALYPFLVPGMDRASLDGVLRALKVPYLDEGDALDRLHDLVKERSGVSVKTPTWTRYRRKWLNAIGDLAAATPTPPVVTKKQLDDAEQERDELAEALDLVEADNELLKEQLAEVSKLKDQDEVREVLRVGDDTDYFEELLAEARSNLRQLDWYLREAILAEFSSQKALTWPEETSERTEVAKAADEGRLHEIDDRLYVASTDFGDVRRAKRAVRAVLDELDEPSEEFVAWFDEKYDVEPNTSSLAVLRRLFLRQ